MTFSSHTTKLNHKTIAETRDIFKLINKSVDELNQNLRGLNCKIFENPETSWQEVQAHDNIATFLQQEGFSVTRHAFGLQTSVLAEYGKGGALVTFCAEYDALPDIGHGCGHNLIATSSIAAFLGAAAALKQVDRPGRVRLLGCPAEEADGGKIKLINAKAFVGVDAALMLHPIPTTTEETTGVSGVSYTTCLAASGFEVVYTGRPAHAAAMPWTGANALDAGNLAYNAVNMLRQQTRPNDRISMIMLEGGTATNVIPERSRLKCTVRSETTREMKALAARVRECFKGAGAATGCNVQFNTVIDHYCDIRPNGPICDEFSRCMDALGYTFQCDFQKKELSSFSTDMGNVTYEVPGFHGNFCIPTEPNVALHTLEFRNASGTLDAHNIALDVGKGMASAAWKILMDTELLRQTKRDFELDQIKR